LLLARLRPNINACDHPVLSLVPGKAVTGFISRYTICGKLTLLERKVSPPMVVLGACTVRLLSRLLYTFGRAVHAHAAQSVQGAVLICRLDL